MACHNFFSRRAASACHGEQNRTPFPTLDNTAYPKFPVGFVANFHFFSSKYFFCGNFHYFFLRNVFLWKFSLFFGERFYIFFLGIFIIFGERFYIFFGNFHFLVDILIFNFCFFLNFFEKISFIEKLKNNTPC